MKYPRKAIQSIVFFIAVMVVVISARSQTTVKANYTYYFEVKNVDSKEEAKLFEASFKNKRDVVRVQGFGIPRVFYILYANKPLTAATVSSWLKKEWTITEFKAITVTKETLVKLKTEKLLKKANL